MYSSYNAILPSNQINQNIMKLQLKHISPYLPYDLKFYIPNDEHSNIQTMTGLSKTDGIQTDYTEEDSVGCIGNLWCLDEGGRNYKYYNIKPILRPLSDLFKEVYYEKYEMKRVLIKDHSVISSLSEEDFKEDAELNTYYHSNLRDNYEIITSLFELHFDVFRLIEKGLAIDINTIEKQNIQ